MIKDTNDQGIDVLLKILHMKGLKDYENLVRKCYEIQSSFQYETERDRPLVLMQKLIEEEVSREYAEAVGDEKQ